MSRQPRAALAAMPNKVLLVALFLMRPIKFLHGRVLMRRGLNYCQQTHPVLFWSVISPIHLGSTGCPFSQVNRTAAAHVGNSFIIISISGAPVTLAPRHCFPKLKQCSSLSSARRTCCFPTIYGNQLQSSAGSAERLTRPKE